MRQGKINEAIYITLVVLLTTLFFCKLLYVDSKLTSKQDKCNIRIVEKQCYHCKDIRLINENINKKEWK